MKYFSQRFSLLFCVKSSIEFMPGNLCIFHFWKSMATWCGGGGGGSTGRWPISASLGLVEMGGSSDSRGGRYVSWILLWELDLRRITIYFFLR